MPNFSEAIASASQLFNMLGQPLPQQQQQAPLQTMQPAQATKGGVLPGTAGLRLTGNQQLDGIIAGSFSRYVQLWGRKLAELKRKYPDRTEADIAAEIGPNPSSVRDMRQFVDYLAKLEVDPEQQRSELDLQKMREQFQMNKELRGEEQAMQIAIEQLRSKSRKEEMAYGAELQASEFEKARAAQRESDIEEREFRRSEANKNRAFDLGQRTADREIEQKKFDLAKQSSLREEEAAKLQREKMAIEIEALKKGVNRDEQDIVDNITQAYMDKKQSLMSLRNAYAAESAKNRPAYKKNKDGKDLTDAEGNKTEYTYDEAFRDAMKKAKELYTDADYVTNPLQAYYGIYTESGRLTPSTRDKIAKLLEKE